MKVDTKAIRARAEAATKGPWEAKFRDNDNGTWADVLAGDAMVCECATSLCDHLTPQNRRDMEFVSSCRTDVPALCDRVEELEAALRAVLDDFPDARRMPESVEAARVALGGGE